MILDISDSKSSQTPEGDLDFTDKNGFQITIENDEFSFERELWLRTNYCALMQLVSDLDTSSENRELIKTYLFEIIASVPCYKLRETELTYILTQACLRLTPEQVNPKPKVTPLITKKKRVHMEVFYPIGEVHRKADLSHVLKAFRGQYKRHSSYSHPSLEG